MVRWETLETLQMQDQNFGWTVEMQVKAAKRRVPFREVSVSFGVPRRGNSKISGTVRGSKAGTIILKTIFKQVTEVTECLMIFAKAPVLYQ